MDKIKKRKRERVNDDIWIEAHWSIDDVADKVNELTEGYNKMRAKIKKMSYYNELDRRLKRLEKIEVKRMLDKRS